jgi:hypothetical protein
MARRPRESSAKMHATPPIMVQTMDPIADHPALGPLRDVRSKKIAKRSRGRSKVRVKVDVEATDGSS